MRVLIFGATGMLGQGVLRECLGSAAVTDVLSVGRALTGLKHPKLREWRFADLSDLDERHGELSGFDACFFCLGVSAVGLSEAAYTRVTHDLTLVIATPLARDNPGMTFVYVSGAGTGVERRAMWARVKGRTEAALTRLPFKAVFLFRPGFVQPLDGVRSKTRWYRVAYALAAPVATLLRALSPAAATTTQALGRAMIAVARNGYPTRVLETRDISVAAARLG